MSSIVPHLSRTKSNESINSVGTEINDDNYIHTNRTDIENDMDLNLNNLIINDENNINDNNQNYNSNDNVSPVHSPINIEFKVILPEPITHTIIETERLKEKILEKKTMLHGSFFNKSDDNHTNNSKSPNNSSHPSTPSTPFNSLYSGSQSYSRTLLSFNGTSPEPLVSIEKKPPITIQRINTNPSISNPSIPSLFAKSKSQSSLNDSPNTKPLCKTTDLQSSLNSIKSPPPPIYVSKKPVSLQAEYVSSNSRSPTANLLFPTQKSWPVDPVSHEFANFNKIHFHNPNPAKIAPPFLSSTASHKTLFSKELELPPRPPATAPLRPSLSSSGLNSGLNTSPSFGSFYNSNLKRADTAVSKPKVTNESERLQSANRKVGPITGFGSTRKKSATITK